jgi:host factor-I protein
MNFYLSKGEDMPKSPFNIQDQYLNQARKERVKVSLVMMTGEKMEGYIKSFDSFCILAECAGDVLIYKHAVSSITSADGSFRLHGGRD